MKSWETLAVNRCVVVGFGAALNFQVETYALENVESTFQCIPRINRALGCCRSCFMGFVRISGVGAEQLEFHAPAIGMSWLSLRAHPCPNRNNVCVPGLYGYQSIHAQTIIKIAPSARGYQDIHAETIITFAFQAHKVIRASMPKP